MIDSWSWDYDGFARFSDDGRMRYRLARAITPGALDQGIGASGDLAPGRTRVTFVMLNPSTADAFKLDPTVKRCCDFARAWGADVLEVVNLFSLRSPDPAVLKAAGSCEAAGGDAINNEEILVACRGAHRVIAAWGLHGRLWGRDLSIAMLLYAFGVKFEILGTTGSGVPKHPLARGKHRIASDVEPRAWA